MQWIHTVRAAPMPTRPMSTRTGPATGPVAQTMAAATILLMMTMAVAMAHEIKPEPVDERSVLTLCDQTAARMEIEYKLPPQLLSAIALAESGRWDRERGTTYAWPWTVVAQGHSYYLSSRQRAIELIYKLRARGVRNIDVGCMQVNLRYHGAAFRTIEEAIDPATNVAYAAVFLRRLHGRTHSWSESVGLYHSGIAARGDPYRARVFRIWVNERKRAALDLRMAQIQ